MHCNGVGRYVLTVDDGDAEIGLDDAAEVEAALGDLGSLDEDDVDVFEPAI